ncbi:toll/interleukin-1 receptor domain-containing protein [Actinosynnema sp. NPDC002837]
MRKIFINYRSSDLDFGASLLDTALSGEFGPDRVFRDARSLRLGDEFHPEIMGAIRESLAMIAVIGPRWAGEVDARGRRQIDRSEDYIRREIIEAFDHDVPVIPVLVDRSRLKPAELPAPLRALAARQYLTLRTRNSHVDLAVLIGALAERLPELRRVERRADRSGALLGGITAQEVGAIFTDRVDVAGDLTIGGPGSWRKGER